MNVGVIIFFFYSYLFTIFLTFTTLHDLQNVNIVGAVDFGLVIIHIYFSHGDLLTKRNIAPIMFVYILQMVKNTIFNQILYEQYIMEY
jgi:hypothetical protein